LAGREEARLETAEAGAGCAPASHQAESMVVAEENRAREKFQPRVEAEEGDPTLADFIIAGVIIVVVVAGLLWAFGYVSWP
jgi:hypothetical protein